VTATAAHEVEKRQRPHRAKTARTPFGALAAVAERVAEQDTTGVGLLSESERKHYRTRPVEFATEVLGIKLWAKQVEIVQAIVEHRRVAIRSGHKCGKSIALAVVALWFYTCFPDARVILTAVTSRQVDGIIWREIRRLLQKSIRPIDGEMHQLAHNGLKADDFREIVGFTARQSEAVSGISGANMLYLCDEASGIDDLIFEAIDGNSAARARVVMISNPTKTSGRFFEAFHERSEHWHTIHVSSLESPNVVAGRNVVDGLASIEWCNEMRDEYGGADSPWFKIRVKGEFVLNEEGRCISLHDIQQAGARWHVTPDEGRLNIGIDPAGPGQGGDESAFAVRRGKKIITVIAIRGLSTEAHLAHLLGIIKVHRRPREAAPSVKVDQDGPIGWAVYSCLRAYEENAKSDAERFDVVGVRSGERAFRNPDKFGYTRDELWWNLAEWIRDDGAIPEDAKLDKELHAPEWKQEASARLRLTPKSELRKMLDRSPDRADACALAVWEPATQHEGVSATKARRAASEDDDLNEDGNINPYGGGLDPYGGGR